MRAERVPGPWWVAAVALAACMHTPPPPAPAAQPIWTSGTAGGYVAVADRLRAQGLKVASFGRVSQPFLRVRGTGLMVNGEVVEVFEYPDVGARRRASSTIARDASTIGAVHVTWAGTPHFWASGRLLILYVGRERDVIRALDRILGFPIARGRAAPG